jgi:serine phosphatase RsbU (regulator of sigma subunit)
MSHENRYSNLGHRGRCAPFYCAGRRLELCGTILLFEITILVKKKMKLLSHFKSYCSFWKPSVARRITLYFVVFGLIIFLVTSFFWMVGEKKHFMRSVSKLIHHQFAQLENSQEPDFIWYGINNKRPDLFNLMTMLESISSSFYTVSGISIYAKDTADESWYRLAFTEDQTLHARPIDDAFTKDLNENIRRRFRHSDVNFESANGELALFVDITRKLDTNYYFLKIGVYSEMLKGIIGKGIVKFIIAFLIALCIFRFVGYYFARKIAGPIENLSAAAADVARGDLSRSVPVTTKDEFGDLAANFNKMVDGLREWERIKVIEFELEKGQQIQKEFLPNAIPQLPNWDIATCFYPAGKVSGDFYDVFTLPDGCLALVIADVCDKGVGSALYMALFRSLLRVFAEQASFCSGPMAAKIDRECGSTDVATASQQEQIIRLRAVPFTNNYIAQIHGEEGMFATLFFGVLNPETGRLCYINGGHEPLYVVNSGKVKTMLKPTGPAVGMMPDTRFNTQEISLDPGDMLVGYTDGVTEARSPSDEIFTRSRLRSLLEQQVASAGDILERVRTNLFSFIDVAPRSDDVTMLAVQRVAK